MRKFFISILSVFLLFTGVQGASALSFSEIFGIFNFASMFDYSENLQNLGANSTLVPIRTSLTQTNPYLLIASSIEPIADTPINRTPVNIIDQQIEDTDEDEFLDDSKETKLSEEEDGGLEIQDSKETKAMKTQLNEVKEVFDTFDLENIVPGDLNTQVTKTLGEAIIDLVEIQEEFEYTEGLGDNDKVLYMNLPSVTQEGLDGGTVEFELSDLQDIKQVLSLLEDIKKEETPSDSSYKITDIDTCTSSFAEKIDNTWKPIKTCKNLQNINNKLSGNYYLANDIDCSETKNWNRGRGFIPIGDGKQKGREFQLSVKNPFTGILYGNCNVITDLYINRSENASSVLSNEHGNGLFDQIENAEVRDVYILNAFVSGFEYNGILAGSSLNSHIENVTVSGEILGDDMNGGLVGYANNSVIKNSGASVNIKGSDMGTPASSYIGGLIGLLENDALVQDSYSTGDVSGTWIVGGLVGQSKSSKIETSYSTGNVSGFMIAGGIVGMIHEGSITDSYTNSVVSGETAELGGVAGISLKATLVNNYWNAGTSGQAQCAGVDDRGVLENCNASFTNIATTPDLLNAWDFMNTWSYDESNPNPQIKSP